MTQIVVMIANEPPDGNLEAQHNLPGNVLFIDYHDADFSLLNPYSPILQDFQDLSHVVPFAISEHHQVAFGHRVAASHRQEFLTLPKSIWRCVTCCEVESKKARPLGEEC